MTRIDLARASDVVAAASAVGFQLVAYPPHTVTSAAFTTGLNLAANGGSIAIPFMLSAPMAFKQFAFRNLDTATARSCEGALYLDVGANTANRVTGTDGSDSWTPSGSASTRVLVGSGDPVTLAPGAYWYVLRNTHASNQLQLATTAVSSNLSISLVQTKTLGSALGSTLDLVAATWTKDTVMVSCRIQGRVLGQSIAGIG